MGLILGGVHGSAESVLADVVLTEHEGQSYVVRRKNPAARVIALSKLPRPEFRPPLLPDADRVFDVAVVGSLTPRKNHGVLEAVASAGVTVAVVGDGPERLRVEELAARSRGRITLLGTLESAAVANVLKRSRVLLHPSRFEGFPRAVVEAMTMGLPTVALRGVLERPFVAGETGLEVDQDDLASALLTLLGDELERERLGRNAMAVAAERFSVELLRTAARELDSALRSVDHRPARRMLPARLRAAEWWARAALDRSVKAVKRAAR